MGGEQRVRETSASDTPARGVMSCQANAPQEGVANAGTDSAWIRRILRDSIYLWACGEKAEDGDEDPKLTDRLIGWLILVMQGFSFTMLIALARAKSKPDIAGSADDTGGSGFLLPSVIGSMYLLIASTTHDLRAGFSLAVDGSCAGHRAFGVALLTVYGIMMSAAMTVLMSTSDDTASVVLNAVTVLFIADLDEKTLKFLSTVPKPWRLFWAIQSIGLSFAVALIAVSYFGDASPLLGETTDLVNTIFSTYWFWGVNPAAVTWGSFRLSSALQTICESIEAGEQTKDNMSTSSFVRSRVLVGLLALLNDAHERLREEPCFVVVKSAWLAQAVGSWIVLLGVIGPPFAFTLVRNTPPSTTLSLVKNEHQKWTMVVLNVVLVIGLVAKVIGLFVRRQERVTANMDLSVERQSNSKYSRVPSLLVGWGIGYWITSLLSVLVWSCNGDVWQNAPLVVTLIGYVVLPSFFIVGIFMLAGPNILGTRLGVYIKRGVDLLRNRRSVVYWSLATVLRDVIMFWVSTCLELRYSSGVLTP